jgi:hypothetical protein
MVVQRCEKIYYALAHPNSKGIDQVMLKCFFKCLHIGTSFISLETVQVYLIPAKSLICFTETKGVSKNWKNALHAAFDNKAKESLKGEAPFEEPHPLSGARLKINVLTRESVK